ncbi:MAG: alpha/beta fold hydrolase [Parvularculaceae bacterium]|nr:alpha/beta fold hydrolase [Parvularculaceae bacterium]
MRLALFLIAAIAIFIAANFLRDTAATRARLAEASVVIDTRAGPVETARYGAGLPVLVLHGAGGGHDQGALLAGAMVGEGFDIIAPSRFGYLRSPLAADASTAAQADALAALLDELGVDRVGVVAMSGGAPPALQFASRRPERVSALVLLSAAPYTPFTIEAQELPVPIFVYNALFASDFPYWLLRRVAPAAIAPMFDARADILRRASAEEREFVRAMMAAFEPVTARVEGLRNEGAAIDPAARYDLASVSAPTLVVHAVDDALNPVAVSERIAEDVAGADLVLLPDGGHLLLGHHGSLRERISRFLRTASARLD